MSIGLDSIQLNKLLALLTRNSVSRIEWATYWYNDEPHDEDCVFLDARGRKVELFTRQYIHTLLYSITAELRKQRGSYYGVFQLDVANRIARCVADAQYHIDVRELPEGQQECIDV